MTEQPPYDYLPVTMEMVKGLEAEYQATENSLLPWYAYALCRDHDIPLPPWVVSYLDRVANNLFYLGMAAEPPPDKPFQAIAEAVEMKRPGDAFRKSKDSSWLSIATDVQFFIQAHELDETYAIDEAAKKHCISAPTARRAWKKFQAIFKKT